MRRIFLTGGTGFLGGFLSYLLAEKGCEITMLVRDLRSQSGKERYFKTLKTLFRDPDLNLVERHVKFLKGDILKENFGLSPESSQWDALVHCAASTDFNESPEQLRRTNVDGVRRVLKFVLRYKIPSLHHVSTAYSAGETKGRIKERILTPQSFRNFYEETKNQAERLCFSTAAENGIRLTIYRPSIIMGESREGRTLNFDGPYLFFKMFLRLSQFVKRHRPSQLLPNGRVRLNIRLPIYGEDEQNLVPVDYVAGFIAHVLLREPLEGKIYHLTNSDPPTVSDLSRVFTRLIPFDGMQFLGEQKVLIDTEEQAFFVEKMRAYWSYLNPRMVFDKTNAFRVEELVGLACPRMSDEVLERFFRYALATNFGKRPLPEAPEGKPSAHETASPGSPRRKAP
jgi:nucleoside-diphosphate-sugar epimerase